jgi:hypothetical protein
MSQQRPASLRCDGCSHRFARRARFVVVVGTFLLCTRCADDLDIHATLFRSCRSRHTVAEHGAYSMTRGLAAWLTSVDTRQ